MSQANDTLYVRVDYYSGQDDGDDGQPYYVATCEQLGAVTDGHNLDELLKNLRELIELAIEDEDTIAVYNVVPNSRISIKT